jgi:ParB family chromosome partitioning protein
MTTHDPPARANGPASIPVALPAARDVAESEITVVQIEPEDNSRKLFDPEQLRALADSIATHGLLNAVIVYRRPDSDRFALLAGERRWRAVQLLGWQTIRARVLGEPPDEAKRCELMLIDNEQRVDLSDIERGKAYLDFMTRTGCTASALAQKVGKHVSTVTRAVKLVEKLPPDLRDAIGPQLPPRVALLLTPLPTDEAKRHYAALYREGKVKSGAELAAAIKGGNGQPEGSTAGFTAEEGGVRVAVTWAAGTAGATSAQALAAAENALRAVIKDLREQGHRGLASFRTFLEKKARAAKKAAEAEAARTALARHGTAGANGGA